MPYDPDLDKELFSESVHLQNTKLTVSVFSYNGAQPKLQISRENANPNTGELRFSKLGRLTKEELEAILPLIQKAHKKM